MNRREFFKRSAKAAAVVAITPTVLVPLLSGRTGYRTYIMAEDAIFTAPPEGSVKYKFLQTPTLPPAISYRIRYIDSTPAVI